MVVLCALHALAEEGLFVAFIDGFVVFSHWWLVMMYYLILHL